MDTDRGRQNLDSLVKYRKESEEESRKHFLDQSRERLKKNIEVKIKTTMIGSLSHIEQAFGQLWGQGKPRESLTDQELAWEEIKDKLRTEILNQGNNQIRAAMAEINSYEVSWSRYHYTSNNGAANPIFGLNEDGSPKKLRHGTNPDGSIKLGPDRPEG
jgi:leucyl aminopeptidase (aminopeptidase T)